MHITLCLTISLAAGLAADAAAEQPIAAVPVTQSLMLNESELIGMRYPEARKKILESGWTPRKTFVKGPNGLERERLSAGYFLSLGYEEVEMCAGTGVDPCNFNFVDSKGHCLRVSTAGELESASVAGVDRQCPELGAE